MRYLSDMLLILLLVVFAMLGLWRFSSAAFHAADSGIHLLLVLPVLSRSVA